jgi:hypothetical protein
MVQQFDAPFMIEQHHRISCCIEHRLELALQTLGPLLLRLGDSK